MTARRRAVYTFRPVGLDAWHPHAFTPPAGTRVVKTAPPSIGCPPSGNVGRTWAYVADAETGAFYGLVLRASLEATGETAAVV